MAETVAGEKIPPIRGAVLIAGPTASGKSALALDIARKARGVVVNADSMQVYAVMRVLTARPGADETAQAPHLLYGHVAPSLAYSTGQWLRDVGDLARQGLFRDRPPVFVGGTGLYFEALSCGISTMPLIAPEIRAHWRARLDAEGAAALHAELSRRDPQTAASLAAADGQRIVRALEVLESSGRSIRDWQGRRSAPLIDAASARMIAIEPDRSWLAQRVEMRLEAMVEQGALEEVRAMEALALDPALPAMKAIGLREFGAYLAGRTPLKAALAEAAGATRRYAKRQATWIRNRFGPEWTRIVLPRTENSRERFTFDKKLPTD